MVVPAPGVNANGTLGTRGFRSHCNRCGFLGPVRANYFTTRRDFERHECSGVLPPLTHRTNERGVLVPVWDAENTP